MTGTNDKIRGVVLAALMVFSVFAGTIALTGAAAADVPEVDQDPVEFTVDQNSNHIEVVFESDASGLNYTLEDANGNSVNVSVNGTLSDLANGRVVLDIGENLNGEPTLTVTDPADGDSDELDVTTTATLIQDPGDTSGDAGVDAETEVFKGERFAVAPDLGGNVTVNEAYDISEGGEFPFLSRTTGQNSLVSALDTGAISELQAGEEYYLTYENSGGNVSLGVRNLGLSAEAEDRSVSFKSGGTAEVEATASSNVAGRQVEFRLLRNGNYEGDEFNVTATIDGDGEVTQTYEVDRAGNYTVEVADLPTDISDTTEAIRVNKVSGDVSFAQSVVTEDRGDVAAITVRMQNRDEATVNIGSDDVNYLASVDIEDDDDDGQVTLLFNTFAPSTQGQTFDVRGDDDNIQNVTFVQPVNNPLGAASYEMNVTDGGVRGAEEAVGTLSLTERSTDNLNIWTAEEGALSDLDEPGPISTYANAGNLTQDSTIAEGDLVVHQLQASGLFGALNATNENNYTDALYQLDTANGSSAINLTIYESPASVGANANGADLTMQSLPLGDVETVADPTNNTLYVMMNSDTIVGAPDAEVDDRFVANFTVPEDSPLTKNNRQTVTGEFRVVDRELEFEATGQVGGDDVVEVEAAANQTINGTTTVAAGTEVSISVRSTGDSPFLLSQDAIVQPDGTFNASFDFTNVSAGQNFTVDASGNWEDDPEIDGIVVEAQTQTETATATPEGTVTETATPEETATATPEGTPTATPEGTPTEEPATPEPTTGGDGAGFGVVVALIALIGAALLAVRRND